MIDVWEQPNTNAHYVTVLVFFALIVGEYSWRTYKRRDRLSYSALALWNTRRFKWFCGAVVVAFVTIFVRCVYRIPELTGGEFQIHNAIPGSSC